MIPGTYNPPSLGKGPPAFINAANGGWSGSASGTLSHTTAADTDALLVGFIGYDAGAGGVPAISGVPTFDGVPLTAVPGGSGSGGSSGYDAAAALYWMPNPAIKTANIAVTWTASVTGRIVAVNARGVTGLDVAGVDAAVTPLEVLLAATAPTIQMAIGFGTKSTAPTFTWSTGVVELYDASPAANYEEAASYRVGAGAENYTYQMVPNATLLAGVLAVAAFK